MDLIKFISGYNLKNIIKLESQDPQFIALKNAWGNITKKYKNSELNKNIFLFLILQNALISYQISGTGELRRGEFANKITNDFGLLKKNINIGNIEWWYNFLTNSKYNNRIYNIKIGRLKKFENIKNYINLNKNFGEYYYENMSKLLKLLCMIMKQKNNSKTLVFAIKMFGYGSRIIFDKIVFYDKNINIPLDSRLKKIYNLNFPKQKNIKDDFLKKYFFELAKKSGIPPLHLDSILRLDYRRQIIKN